MAIFTLLTLLLSVVPALSSPLVAERTTCNRDNVLRALVDKRYIDEAIPFCSTYISVPASTVTATTSCVTTTLTLVIDPLPVTTYEWHCPSISCLMLMASQHFYSNRHSHDHASGFNCLLNLRSSILQGETRCGSANIRLAVPGFENFQCLLVPDHHAIHHYSAMPYSSKEDQRALIGSA
jgi:hypothetical protein